MQLDDHLKNLLRELGHAINDTVSDSDRITGAIAGVRAHGYDIVLKLDATIGLAKRDAVFVGSPEMNASPNARTRHILLCFGKAVPAPRQRSARNKEYRTKCQLIGAD